MLGQKKETGLLKRMRQPRSLIDCANRIQLRCHVRPAYQMVGQATPLKISSQLLRKILACTDHDGIDSRQPLGSANAIVQSLRIDLLVVQPAIAATSCFFSWPRRIHPVDTPRRAPIQPGLR